MAVSVRMDPTLEQEIERAAKRQGITKSQFIVDAVERALGRKDSYKLLLKVQKQYGLAAARGAASHRVAEPAVDAPSMSERYRSDLRTRHDADMKDWLAFQAAKKRGEVWKPDDAAASPPSPPSLPPLRRGKA